jgi:hypothetical protein
MTFLTLILFWILNLIAYGIAQFINLLLLALLIAVIALCVWLVGKAWELLRK